MKKIRFIAALSALIITASLCGCENGRTEESSEKSDTVSEAASSVAVSEEPSEEPSAVSEEVSDVTELKKIPVPEGAHMITNLNYSNQGKKMGDNDGPAYCVYAKKGYNKASMDVLFSQMKINTIRQSDGKFVNAYIFLGSDIYDGEWWTNCFDCGFCWSGKNPSWHVFYNIYKCADENAAGWYESKVKLDITHDYRLVLDTSSADETATLTVIDITDGGKIADSVTFGVLGMKADGSNTAYLMDFALDYPDNVKLGTDGKPSDDFEQITLYNTDEDIYMQNVLTENVKIWKRGEELVWDSSVTDHRSLWPEKGQTAFDYVCTAVIADEESYDFAFRVDLDMNR